MAPAAGPIVEKIMSVISTGPDEPALPTLTTGWGFASSWKALPLPAMTLHASPTIFVPEGMLIVEETTYVPASKKMILQFEYWQCLSVPTRCGEYCDD
jgi:hypothetical protein